MFHVGDLVGHQDGALDFHVEDRSGQSSTWETSSFIKTTPSISTWNTGLAVDAWTIREPKRAQDVADAADAPS